MRGAAAFPAAFPARLVLFLAALGLSGPIAGAVRAAAPTLEHLWPAGGVPGSTNRVTLSGKFDPWPARFWVGGGDGVSVVATTNASKVDVVVAPGAVPGPRLVRAYNDEGASEPRFWVVGSGAEAADTEPNDRFQQPQALETLPVTVEGRLDKGGDVDSFRVVARAGQWLEARLDAFCLMSKLDGVLRLVTTNGLQLAWNHDALALDPRLVWRATADGPVVLQVFGFRYPADASVVLGGGEGAVYRLAVRLLESAPVPESAGARPEAETATDIAGGVEGARVLEAPWAVLGVIDAGTDEDRYRLRAAKDEALIVEVRTASLGSPLDAWLRIESAAGKELAFVDDTAGGRDPRIDWKAPEAGEFTVVVGSRSHRGGAEAVYRLEARRPEPDFQGRVAAGAFVAEAGSTNVLKIPVTVTRLAGQTNALELVARGLPEGVTAAPVAAPAKDGEAAMSVVAAAGAKAFQGPVQLVLVEAGTARERTVAWDLVSAGENNGVPQGWSRLVVERTDQLWLTVRPKPEAAAK